jgi:hypothetical protein
MVHRVLLSTMKSNAEHPCPRCFVKKIDTIKMGMQFDLRYRRTNVRIDDHLRQFDVRHARRLIFEKGIPLSSDRLTRILGKYSGIPTYVSPNTLYVSSPMLTHPEYIFSKT